MSEAASHLVRARKIAELRARVARVRELAPPDLESFIARRTEAEALIFNLYLALQASSDLALRLVSERGLAIPGNPREAFETLARAGVIEHALAGRLAASVGLRNRIAHQYTTLDLALVLGVVRDDLADLESFAARAAVA